jgi:hypothetical protein
MDTPALIRELRVIRRGKKAPSPPLLRRRI